MFALMVTRAVPPPIAQVRCVIWACAAIPGVPTTSRTELKPTWIAAEQAALPVWVETRASPEAIATPPYAIRVPARLPPVRTAFSTRMNRTWIAAVYAMPAPQPSHVIRRLIVKAWCAPQTSAKSPCAVTASKIALRPMWTAVAPARTAWTERCAWSPEIAKTTTVKTTCVSRAAMAQRTELKPTPIVVEVAAAARTGARAASTATARAAIAKVTCASHAVTAQRMVTKRMWTVAEAAAVAPTVVIARFMPTVSVVFAPATCASPPPAPTES